MKKIVVIDDEIAVAKSGAAMLRFRGYSPEIATSGLEGIELVNRIDPQLVITDMRMPLVTGEDVFHALRASPRTFNIPVLIISAYGWEHCKEAGDAHLQKPFRVNELLRMVESLIAPLHDTECSQPPFALGR